MTTESTNISEASTNPSHEVSCPDCNEGKITAGCSIDRPLISVDCGRCKGTGRVSLPTISLPFSLDDIKNKPARSPEASTEQAELLPERITAGPCSKCGSMLVGMNACPYCGNEWVGTRVQYTRTVSPTPIDTVPACVKCGHNEVGADGLCHKSFAIVPSSGVWKDTHCGCKCEFSYSRENKALEWQPISTAPKDGSEVLLMVERRAGIAHGMLVGHYMPGGHCIEDHPAIDEGWYFWNGSMFDRASKPVRWMPLPPEDAKCVKCGHSLDYAKATRGIPLIEPFCICGCKCVFSPASAAPID